MVPNKYNYIKKYFLSVILVFTVKEARYPESFQK